MSRNPDVSFITSDSVIFRHVQNETVLVHLDSGEIYYFTPETLEFLNHMKTPRKIQDSDSLNVFCKVLLQNKILQETTEEGVEFGELPLEPGKLAFLRKDEKTIDDIAFLCP